MERDLERRNASNRSGIVHSCSLIGRPVPSRYARPAAASGYRYMNGYGSHTYSLISDQGQRVWCKFHAAR
jgi:hypothetical protein